MATIKKRIEKANELLKTQGKDGNWNVNEYMCGIYNGMECLMATIEEREPIYKSLLSERKKQYENNA